MPSRSQPFVPASVPSARPPRVWVLLGEGAGGNAQMIALAEALGWPYETRQLSWNVLNYLPNPIIGARAFTLDRAADALRPPWPDLVIAASRRSAPVARWIKKQSGGRTKLVHLLHAQMPLHHFDLVVTLAQFRVPDAPNVLRNTLPLNVVDPARQAEAADALARATGGIATAVDCGARRRQQLKLHPGCANRRAPRPRSRCRSARAGGQPAHHDQPAYPDCRCRGTDGRDRFASRDLSLAAG